MEELFSIFRVYDYKGGELSSTLNIDKESVLWELEEAISSSYEFDEMIEKFKDGTKDEKRKACYEMIDELIDDYAGAGGFCAKIFLHTDGLLREMRISHFREALCNLILEEGFFGIIH